MADMFNPYEQQIIGLKEQKALAQKLREQAMEPTQGQMVSGWYVPPSWTQMLAKGVNAYMAGKKEKEAEQGIKDVMKQRQQDITGLMGELPQERVIRPENAPESGMGPILPAVTQKPTARDYMAWGLRAAQVDPSLAQYGQTMAGMVQHEEAQQEARNARREDLQMRLEEGRLSQQERIAAQKDLERIRAEDRAAEAERNRIFRQEAAARDAQLRKDLTAMNIQGRKDIASENRESKGKKGEKQEQWKYDAGSDTWVMPPTAEYPMGRSTPNVGKVSAFENLKFLNNQFLGTKEAPGIVDRATTGGWFGLKGTLTSGTQSAREFDNQVEQMSTELRKIFRIPGEGALSDKEQAQYGIQLPKRGNDPALNRQILQSLMVRAENATMPPVNPMQPRGGASGNWGGARTDVVPNPMNAPANQGGFSIRPKGQ